MSKPEHVAAEAAQDQAAIEGPAPTHLIPTSQALGIASVVPSDVSCRDSSSSMSSLEDESPLQYFQSDPGLFDSDTEGYEGGLRMGPCAITEDTLTLELPPELNHDEDLMDMALHDRKLRHLHALVYENSVTAILERGDLLVQHPNHDDQPQAIQPSKRQKISKAVSDENDTSTLTMAYRYIECYNILERICDNLRLLQQKDFCKDEISFLHINSSRPEVTKLDQISIRDVADLYSKMTRYLEKSFGLSEDSSLLDNFDLSPSVLNGLKEMRTPEQHRAALDNRNVPPKKPSVDLYRRYQASSQSPSYQQRESLISNLHSSLVVGLHNLASSLFISLPLNTHGSGAYTMLRSIDLMVISYAGAHVLDPMLPGEQQDRKYLHIHGRKMSYDTEIQPDKSTVIITQRKLKCLDGFFGGQKLWIFHMESIKPNEELSLYLSTYPDDFADIWGPMWKIVPSEDSQDVLRYDLENGSIVRSQTPAGGWEMKTYTDELNCHWISNHDLKIWETHNDSLETLMTSEEADQLVRLLIGASNKIRLVENSEICFCDSSRLKTFLNNRGYLRTAETSKTRRNVDAETFAATVGSGSPGVSFGYSRSTKVIAGKTFKECLLKRWLHEKTRCNPYILLQYRGIEISQCTSHSRRIRLVDLLATKTMMMWFKTINPIKSSEAAARIEEMLKSDQSQLVECYVKEPAMRETIGDLVGACLDVLSETGCTAESSTALSAFWMFGNEEHLVGYPPKQFKWSGLVQDSDSGCAFVVLEDKCLILSRGRGCQHRSGKPRTSNEQYGSFLETSLIINDQKRLPAGLALCRGNKSDKRAWWSLKDVENGSFRIGDHGSLKVIKPISDRHLLVRWSDERSFVSGSRALAARILSSDPAKFHREFISIAADPNFAPVPIFVVS